MKFKKYNLLILFFLFNGFMINNAQAQNYEVINMNKLISEIDNIYTEFHNNEQLLFDFNLMNLNEEEINELITNNNELTSSMIEKVKTAPQVWELFKSEPVVGLVNFEAFQFPDNITFDKKKFTITKLRDKQNVYLKELVYQFKYNDNFLLIKLAIYHLLDEKGNIEYSYKAARNKFLSNFLLISRPIYEVYEIPKNHIGLFSVRLRFDIYPEGRYSWVYKNANVIVENNGIPEALFMEICYWLQQELEKNVIY